jgi:hypothetical protein
MNHAITSHASLFGTPPEHLKMEFDAHRLAAIRPARPPAREFDASGEVFAPNEKARRKRLAAWNDVTGIARSRGGDRYNTKDEGDEDKTAEASDDAWTC